ncbi:MAG: glycosyltransferase family A protein [Candidatus Melainabacteria bacterium]|nr:glycosyltransferase family A protein [Candidatus Melainabacteria bacterium]
MSRWTASRCNATRQWFKSLSGVGSMANYPRVTVVVPVYNSKPYVMACLESIRRQDYPHMALAIVDDGSTDGTPAAITQWMDEHTDRVAAVFWQLPHNVGCNPAVRNLALVHLLPEDTQLVAFMDSDDCYVGPHAMSALVDALAKHPYAFAAYGAKAHWPQALPMESLCLFDRPLRPVVWPKNNALSWKNLVNGFVPHYYQALLVRKSHLPVLPYYPLGSDRAFYSRLYGISAQQYGGSLGGIVPVETPVFYYRKRPNSVVRQVSEARLRLQASLIPTLTEDFFKTSGIPVVWHTAVSRSRLSFAQWHTRLENLAATQPPEHVAFLLDLMRQDPLLLPNHRAWLMKAFAINPAARTHAHAN